MRVPFRISKSQWKTRLCTFKRLTLGLFVYAQYHRIVRRIQIHPYNVPHFLNKKGIGRQLERFPEMRLESESFPHSIYRRMRNSRLIGHRTGRPMRRAFRLAFECLVDQIRHLCIRNAARSAGTKFVMQSFQASFIEPLTPLSHRNTRQSNSLSYFHIAQSIGSKKDNSKTIAQPARQRAGSRIGFKLFTFLFAKFESLRTAPPFGHVTPPVFLGNHA